jgi:hypothetical protein
MSALLVPLAVLLQVSASALPLLEDQFGKPDGPSRHPGGLVVLICGAPNKLRQMKGWEDGLKPKLGPEVDFLRVVDGRHITRSQQEEAKATLRKKVSPQISILLDWEGRYWEALNLEPGTVELAFFSHGNPLPYRSSGRWSPTTGATVLQQLEHFRDSS